MQPIKHQLNYRILYADTDAMGVVYYANYLRIYEAARGDFMRKIGFSFNKMEEYGIVCPAIKAEIEYIRFAKFDQVVNVITTISEKPVAKLDFLQEMYNEESVLLNKAKITLGFVKTKNQRATRCPNWLLELF